MTTHVMIDIETLDTAPTSVILSVGAVKFDPFTDTEPHAKTLWRPHIEAAPLAKALWSFGLNKTNTLGKALSQMRVELRQTSSLNH